MSNDVNSPPLPGSNIVPVKTLAQLFSYRTNSYKYLFFIALLERLHHNSFAAETPISISDLLIDMLVLAWYPHVYFKLSFGTQDKIAEELEIVSTDSLGQKFKPWERELVRKHIAEHAAPKHLGKYVPFRLIRPFFPDLAGLPDQKVDTKVKEYSAALFDERIPLYRISADETHIHVHRKWCEYLGENFIIVRDWANWNLLLYMQARNPLVPSLASKLFPPAERESLSAQTKAWKRVVQSYDLKCIYTGESIRTIDQWALDHFIPWSFVVHNHIWNLIPVSTTANSSKSDRLPSSIYIADFVDAHFAAASFFAQQIDKQSEQWVGQYMQTLKITEVANKDLFRAAFREVLENHLALAESLGFAKDWSAPAQR